MVSVIALDVDTILDKNLDTISLRISIGKTLYGRDL